MEDKDTPTLEGSKQSAALDKFFEAMAKAQGQFQPAELDGVGHYGKYSTISAVLAAVRKPLAENGIANGDYSTEWTDTYKHISSPGKSFPSVTRYYVIERDFESERLLNTH